MGTVKYTGPVASFHCPTEATIRSLKVHFSPKQLGSGDPSPENVREIVGWDGVEVYRNDSTTNYEFGVLGKNKFPASDGKTSDIFLATNTTYTFSATSPSAGYFKGWYEDETDTGLIWINAGADGNRRWKTYTPEKNIIKGLFYVGTGMSECQIELGSSATTYESYDPNKTVYGGWVDLITGEVQEEWVKHDMSQINIASPSSTSEPWNHIFTIRGVWNETSYDKKHGVDNVVCEVARRRVGSESYANGIMNAISNSSAIYFYDDTVETAEEFKEKYAGKYIAYETNFPVSYSLAPLEMQTFLSYNNVWSNADYVEVEYDLHETQDILARKQFIIANQPHVEKLAAAPLQSFITDMAAPLKECKVYFSPVQEGEGDPSPENVLPISGWTRINVTISPTQQAIEGQTLALDWTNEAGTIYGGYVDLMTGEVWAEYYKTTWDGENVKANRAYEQNGNYGCGYVYVSPSGLSAKYKNGVPTNIWCENVPLYIGVSQIPEPPYVYAPLASALYLVIYFAKAADHPELADNTARINYGNEWLKSNPITVVYQLATPTIVATLTPTQLKTLRGTNNIWSNSNGPVEVQFWRH